MIRKIVFLFTIAALTITSSCKKGEIVSSEKESTAVTPSATPQNTTPAPPADGKCPVMTFAEAEYDFGNINATDKVIHVFKFENTGEADLLISKAVGSCGCTVPEFPKDPIKPGQTAEIKVSFDPTNKKGMQKKGVTIYTNTAAGQEKISIKAAIEDGGAKSNT